MRSGLKCKKRSEETQTLCVGYYKAKSPRRTPPSPGPRFNHLETVTTFTCKPSLVRIDVGNFELSWYPQTNPQTEPITIHCAEASAQCNYSIIALGLYHNTVYALMHTTDRNFGRTLILVTHTNYLGDLSPVPRDLRHCS